MFQRMKLKYFLVMIDQSTTKNQGKEWASDFFNPSHIEMLSSKKK